MLAWHVSLLLEQDSSVPATRVLFNVVQVAGLQKSGLVFARCRRGTHNRSDMTFVKKITPRYFWYFIFCTKKGINCGICMSQPPAIRLRYFIPIYPICKSILVVGSGMPTYNWQEDNYFHLVFESFWFFDCVCSLILMYLYSVFWVSYSGLG